jgi:hypothetical protein
MGTHVHIVTTEGGFEGGSFGIKILHPIAGGTTGSTVGANGTFQNTGGVAPNNVIMQLGSVNQNLILSPDPGTQGSDNLTWHASFSGVPDGNDWVFGILATLGTITTGVSSGFTVSG